MTRSQSKRFSAVPTSASPRFTLTFVTKTICSSAEYMTFFTGLMHDGSPCSRAVREDLLVQHTNFRIDQHRQQGEVRKPANGRVIHEHLHEALSEMISDDLKKSLLRGQSRTSGVPLELLVEYIASTFILVL